METLCSPSLSGWAQKTVLAGGAAFAAIFAWKRYRDADSVLGLDPFREAARVLADRELESKNLYRGGTAGGSVARSPPSRPARSLAVAGRGTLTVQARSG